MKWYSILVVTLLLMIAAAFASDDVKTAKVLAVKKYDQGRIAYFEGRVPIFDGYPFYDITIELGQKKYVVRYESLTGYYPSNWKVGSEIQVKLREKGRMYLLNGDEEVAANIFNERAQNCVPSNTRSAMVGPGPQVPCD